MAAAARSRYDAYQRIFRRVDCLRERLRTEDNVAAIVPKLMVQGTILSPAEHFIDYIRHQFRYGKRWARMPAYSGPDQRLQFRIHLECPGAAIDRRFSRRVLAGLPGPCCFPALCASGYRVYVLHAVLAHDLAESNLNARPIWRFRSVSRHRRSSSNVQETSATGCSIGYGSCDRSGACGPIWINASGKRRRGRPCSSVPPDSSRYTQKGL